VISWNRIFKKFRSGVGCKILYSLSAGSLDEVLSDSGFGFSCC
jgi:hypothetical protein